MLTLYDNLHSGNGYKVRLILRRLGIAFRRIEMDTHGGGTRTSAFLAINPNGKIPTLVFDDGRVLTESNAILVHFGQGTGWLPEDPWQQALVFQWLFWEQYSHEPNVAVARSMIHVGVPPEEQAVLAERQDKGRDALALMDRHLGERPWLVGDRATVADIALFAYTHVAPEGGIDLAPYPQVGAWTDRFRALDGFFPIDHDAGWDQPDAA